MSVGDAKATPLDLFPEKSDAVLLLGGLGGFWISWGGLVGVALLQGRHNSSPWSLLVVLAMVGSVVAYQVELRRMDLRIRGDNARPWPRGPSMGTQIRATLPSTMKLAGRRLGLDGRLVVAVLYSALLIDATVFILLISRR